MLDDGHVATCLVETQLRGHLFNGSAFWKLVHERC